VKEEILILDFGSKYTQLVARRVREMNIFSEVYPYNCSVEKIQIVEPNGIILSSSTSLDADLSVVEKEISKLDIPILSICYSLETQDENDKVIKKFLTEDCKCTFQWNAATFIRENIESIKREVGEGKVLCATSGGVDSSVLAILLHRAIGKQLYCMHIDTGLMRKDESKQVVKMFKEKFNITLDHVDASDIFLSKLAGVEDPEKKRKIIGTTYIDVFEKEARKFGKLDFLAQGTIYPDVLESIPVKGYTIKSHHNVGGMPEEMNMSLIEPFRYLFKDEVRKIGRKLELPDELIDRHPFPGPGLGIRVVGEVTREKLDLVREADYIFIDEIKKAGIYNDIWQAFVILLPVKSVGVMNEKRTYELTVVLRAINSIDAMTADWVKMDYSVLEKTSNRIIKNVKGINRVVYDISSKPPATIEWE
jgi:GMP synthase (glutamine-hydrolysing)